MYRITKRVRFSYGHRLLAHEGKCARLHGHNALVEIDVVGESLDPVGRVLDFAEIAEAAAWFIRERLDHRMLLRRDDPAAALLASAGEDVCLLDENPTAEHLAELIHRGVSARGIAVASVRFWETEDSMAEFRAGSSASAPEASRGDDSRKGSGRNEASPLDST